MKKCVLLILVVAESWWAGPEVPAQSLRQLLDQAAAAYPLYKVHAHEVQAERNRSTGVRRDALPSLEAGYQLNYATFNNITGMATGRHFVPISGPPSEDNTYDGVFGSAAGLVMDWELYAFGQQRSREAWAEASVEHATADSARSVFLHRLRTIEAYLDVVFADALAEVHARNLERAVATSRIVQSLVHSGLRPGVDSASFTTELTRARIDWMNSENSGKTARIRLSQLTSLPHDSLEPDISFVESLPVRFSDLPAVEHPFLRLSAARLHLQETEKTILKKEIMPQLSMWGTAYARGSGIRYDGFIDPQEGLSFSRYNYGAGLVIHVPLLEVSRLRPRLLEQDAKIRAFKERHALNQLEMQGQLEIALQQYENARAIAVESPALQASAEYAYRVMLSRYRSGLVNFAELIQSQYALVKAETEMRLNYLAAWRSLLASSAAAGDLDLFLNQTP
jgi:outer membrane protein